MLNDYLDEIDFPCSATYLGYYCAIHGQHDFTKDREILKTQTPLLESNIHDTLKKHKLYDMIQQLKAEVKFIENKINEKEIKKPIDKPTGVIQI